MPRTHLILLVLPLALAACVPGVVAAATGTADVAFWRVAR